MVCYRRSVHERVVLRLEIVSPSPISAAGELAVKTRRVVLLLVAVFLFSVISIQWRLLHIRITSVRSLVVG